jgi:hypothetical protein
MDLLVHEVRSTKAGGARLEDAYKPCGGVDRSRASVARRPDLSSSRQGDRPNL